MEKALSVQEINRLWAGLAPRVARASEEASRQAERVRGGPRPPARQGGRTGRSLWAGAAMLLAALMLASAEG
ncbi:MAG: hypothetical protein FWG93_07380 [Oscillospiraceae bacterium]|nr:hypothetical protein [Oscillospiraceae bacterium]